MVHPARDQRELRDAIGTIKRLAYTSAHLHARACVRLSTRFRSVRPVVAPAATRFLGYCGFLQYRGWSVRVTQQLLRSMTKIIRSQNPTTVQMRTPSHTSSMAWKACCLLLASLAFVNAQAQSIVVPNGSFESPTPPQGYPATPQVDVWQKPPQPDGIPLPPGIAWDQLSGVFPNTAAGSADHIDNVTGNQAAYLFAIPGVGLSQALDATFEVGKSYALSVGALGGGGIAEGSTLQLGLFYLDAGNALSPVAVTPINYTAASFPNATHLLDFQALSAAVAAGDPWAGKRIEVGLFSTYGTGSGYWDVDNVRLAVVPEPGTVGLAAIGIGGLLVARRRTRRHV